MQKIYVDVKLEYIFGLNSISQHKRFYNQYGYISYISYLMVNKCHFTLSIYLTNLRQANELDIFAITTF